MVPILLQTGTPNLSQRIRFLLCWTLDVFLKADSDAPWQPWFIVIHPASHGHLVGRMSDGKSKPIDCTYSAYLGIQTWPESNRSRYIARSFFSAGKRINQGGNPLCDFCLRSHKVSRFWYVLALCGKLHLHLGRHCKWLQHYQWQAFPIWASLSSMQCWLE